MFASPWAAPSNGPRLPVQVREGSYDAKCDIWSFGCLLYEMACLEAPFRASNQLALAAKIAAGRHAPLPTRYSARLRRLVESMLDVVPHRRPSIDQVLAAACPGADDATAVLEERLRERERMLDEREAGLDRRERDLDRRERALLLMDPSMYDDEFRTPKQEKRAVPRVGGVRHDLLAQLNRRLTISPIK